MKKHSIDLYSADTPLVFGLCGIVCSVCVCVGVVVCRCNGVRVQLTMSKGQGNAPSCTTELAG